MDVKFEGQNVDRHLDLTVHNEQCQPAETPPWPYIDNAAIGATSPCNKEPDNDYATQVAANCADPKDHPEQCKTDDCCNCKGRRCMLVHGGLGAKNECCGTPDSASYHSRDGPLRPARNTPDEVDPGCPPTISAGRIEDV